MGLDRIAKIKEKYNVLDYARDVLGWPVKRDGDRCKSFAPDSQNPTALIVFTDHWYDFKQGLGGDIIDLVAYVKYGGDKGKAIQELGGGYDKDWVEYTQNYCLAIAHFHSNLRDSDLSYLKRRGIKKTTIERLKLGYDAKEDRLTIPYFKNGYVAYCIGRDRSGKEGVSKYKKDYLDGMNENIPWGLHTFSDEHRDLMEKNINDAKKQALIDKYTVIAEGAFDAMSFEQEGFRVLSPISGYFNQYSLKQVLSMVKTTPYVFVCFDSDSAGTRFTMNMCQVLFKNRIKFKCGQLPEGVKDVSDYYAAGGDLFELVADAKPGIQMLASKLTDSDELKVAVYNESLNDATQTTVDGQNATVTTTLDRPGFVRIDVWANAEGAEKPVTKNIGVAFQPEDVTRFSPRPADFDDFWDAQLARLAAVPVVELERKPVEIPEEYADDLVCYDIKVQCVDGTPVSGYLTMPKDAAPGSLPAVVTYHGAGVYSAGPLLDMARAGAVTFNVNAHGVENGREQEYYKELARGPLADYWFIGDNDREKAYFLGMFLRAKRALDYMKTLPEYDGKNLFVGGGSQGGAQAIVAAALDEDVVFATPEAPWLCGLDAKLHNRNFPGWPEFIKLDENGEPVDPAVPETLRYFDMVNFAPRINCKVSLTWGLVDYTCLPSGIMAMYSEISSTDKCWRMFENETHAGPKLYHAGSAALADHVKACHER